jgi:monoamine oxidase
MPTVFGDQRMVRHAAHLRCRDEPASHPVAVESRVDGRLIFAGEHTSGDFSGFMNGAVQSGNRAAKEILQSKRTERPKAA